MGTESDAARRKRDKHPGTPSWPTAPEATNENALNANALQLDPSVGMLKGDLISVLSFVLVLAASEVLSWFQFGDAIVAFYIFVAELFLAAKIFGWPKPAWFGAGRIASLQARWGSQPIGTTYYASDESNRTKFNLVLRNFVSTSIYKDNTEKLCNQINDSMTIKSILAIFAMLAAMFLVKSANRVNFADLEGIVKFIAAASGALLPLVWDFSRCEKQKYWNREMRDP